MLPLIAIADSDVSFRRVLVDGLTARGFVVTAFADGDSFLEQFSGEPRVQLALLDWALATRSGVDARHLLLERGFHAPVIFMANEPTVDMELDALESGAVDFVAKDRGVDILACRSHRALHIAKAYTTVRRGHLLLRSDTGRVYWRGRDVGLTFMEYKLVALLVSRARTSVSYREMYGRLYFAGFSAGDGDAGLGLNARSMIKRTRRKFRRIDPGFSEIGTVPNVGYFWRSLTMNSSDTAASLPLTPLRS